MSLRMSAKTGNCLAMLWRHEIETDQGRGDLECSFLSILSIPGHIILISFHSKNKIWALILNIGCIPNSMQSSARDRSNKISRVMYSTKHLHFDSPKYVCCNLGNSFCCFIPTPVSVPRNTKVQCWGKELMNLAIIVSFRMTNVTAR